MGKYCINCKHYSDGFVGQNYIGDSCDRPIIDLVKGPKTSLGSPAYIERLKESGCGQKGKFFEAKPIKPIKISLFKRIFKK